MRFVAHDTPRAFLDRALSWLMESEAENNLVLSLAAQADREFPEGAPAWFASVEEGADVLGVAFRTPPHMLGLSRMPVAAVPLVTRMAAETFAQIPGVVGPEDEAAACAEIWAASHPVRSRLEMRMGIYALEGVVPAPRSVPGHLHPVEAGKSGAFVPWMEGFEKDTGIFSAGAGDTVRRLAETGSLFIWVVDDVPVAMAGTSGTTPHGVRLGYVYTPPELRGRGYAGALTAALSRQLLGAGRRFCFLYTNPADPVPNAIYRRIGYEIVSRAACYRFDSP